MTVKDKLDKLLARVEKPARYIGGELYSAVKDPESVGTRFAFAFPDTYEIGMSYMGMQIIYHVLNQQKDVYCERVFAPALDMEAEMRKEGLPLFTLETKTPVKEMDIVGFTLQYELSFTNILNMLQLSEIPFRSEERGDEYPLVAAGGPCAFNPEPLAPFVDFFMLGDGEELLVEVCEAHRRWKGTGRTKRQFLEELCQIEGVYVPAFYQPVYEGDKLTAMKKVFEQAPDVIKKRIVHNLENAPFPDKTIVPLVEVVHDRSVIEIFRGCTRGCRFCQAGMLYRPVRERSADRIKELAQNQLKATGHDEMSILSLSTSDHSQIETLVTDLMTECKKRSISLSLPSLRLDSFSFKVLEEIQGVKKTGLTFAPEAGTQRLRDVINKNISDEDIYNAVEQAIKLGWTGMKLYFMIGLPTETFEDLDGIGEIARNILYLAYKLNDNKKGRFNVTVSVSNFVPKSHTPFQWCPQDSADTFREKHEYLKEKFKKIKGAMLTYHVADTSKLEAVFAKGDRRTSSLLQKALEAGCKFDGWREHFHYDRWLSAAEAAGIEFDQYTTKTYGDGEILPWSHISCGVSESFLKSEWEKALAQSVTHDCRRGCVGCGINERTVCEREGTL